MGWLDRLLGRAAAYLPTRLDELGERSVDDRVELTGTVEALTLLHDPISGEPAVAISYQAKPPAIIQRYFGVVSEPTVYEGRQGTDFVLSEAGVSVLIEVAPGGPIDELHARLSGEFGVNLQAGVERISPGDRVTIHGRLRSVDVGGSPHRRARWSAVVVADELDAQ